MGAIREQRFRSGQQELTCNRWISASHSIHGVLDGCLGFIKQRQPCACGLSDGTLRHQGQPVRPHQLPPFCPAKAATGLRGVCRLREQERRPHWRQSFTLAGFSALHPRRSKIMM